MVQDGAPNKRLLLAVSALLLERRDESQQVVTLFIPPDLAGPLH